MAVPVVHYSYCFRQNVHNIFQLLIFLQLLEYIAEVFPEKIANLPEENSRTLLNTINLGLSSFGSQVCITSFC